MKDLSLLSNKSLHQTLKLRRLIHSKYQSKTQLNIKKSKQQRVRSIIKITEGMITLNVEELIEEGTKIEEVAIWINKIEVATITDKK